MFYYLVKRKKKKLMLFVQHYFFKLKERKRVNKRTRKFNKYYIQKVLRYKIKNNTTGKKHLNLSLDRI